MLVIDHAPGSRWSWCAAEDLQVEAAWRAVDRRKIRREENFMAAQEFPDYAALGARLAAQGARSRERILAYRDRTPISIPMPCRLALLLR